MAETNPNLTENAWVKVATNKSYGFIVPLEGKTKDFKFWRKAVLTGAAAPTTNHLLSPRAFKNAYIVEINNSAPIDAYIYTVRRVPDSTLSATIEDAIMVSA